MNRKILKLAIPNIISNITVPLLGMVDLAIVGHLDRLVYIDAIAVGGMIFNFLYWNFGFLRMGTSGFAAQAYGARNIDETVRVLARAVSVAFAVALVIILLQKPIVNFALDIIDGSREMKNFAYQYFSIRVWAAPATLGIYAFKGWFIGMQNARTPMIITVAQNLFNIAFSLFFVFVMNMKIEGVALGTLLAQYLSLFLSMFYFEKYYGKLRRRIKFNEILLLKPMLKFFKVNGDIFLRTLCLVCVFTFFTAASSRFGDVELAVNTLLLQLFTLTSYIMDGFAYAGEALVGKSTGAKNVALTSKIIRRLFIWGAALSVVFVLFYIFAGKEILRFFTNQTAVLARADDFFFWVLIIPLVSFSAFLWDGIFVGATESRLMRNSMFVATAVFFAIYFSFSNVMQNNALWLAFVIYLAMRGLMQWVMWNMKKRKAESLN